MDEVAEHLISDYLAGPERLSLFRGSKALAVAVLQNTPVMTFAPGGMEATSSDIEISTAMQLASHATHAAVTLAMHGRLVTPTEAVWQRMTTLSLHDLQLSPETSSVLRQLSSPQHLHTLCLKRCTLDFRSSRVASSSIGAPLPVRSLTYSEPRLGDTQLELALSLIDKAQLQELTVHASQHTAKLLPLKQLPALQRLALSGGPVQDAAFKFILAHPTLQSLTLDDLQLKDCSKVQPRSLQEIRLHSCDADKLAALPLAHIQRCIAEGIQDLGSKGFPRPGLSPAFTTALQHEDKLVFQATTDAKNWDPAAPVFQATLMCDQETQRRIITMCGAVQGALAFVNASNGTLQAIHAALPASITTLCFTEVVQIRFTAWGGSLINNLPPQVNHLVMSYLHMGPRELHALVTGVNRRIKLTLHKILLEDPDPEFEPGVYSEWDGHDIRVQKAARAWLSRYPNQVELEVVGDPSEE